MVKLKRVVTIWLMLLVWPVLAADVQIRGNPGTVAVGQPFQLVFVVTGSPSGEPDFSPLREHFDLLSTSTSSQFSMVNGRTSQSRQYQMTLAARQTGKVVVPGISFGGDMSPAIELEVTEGSVQATPPGVEESGDELRVVASVDVDDPYVQQQVLLKVRIYSSSGWQQARLSEPRYEGGELLVHQLGQDVQYSTELDGKSYRVVERSYTLVPQQSGKLEIMPFTLTAAAQAPGQGQGFGGLFNDPFSRGNRVSRYARSEPIQLRIKPIPSEFKGGQWLPAREIRLEENWSVDTEALTAGEPATRTIALIADGVSIGQLPEITEPGIDGIRVYPESPVAHEQGTEAGLLSTSSRKFVFVPETRGAYQLPGVELPWWNVVSNQMEVARLPARQLEVAHGASARAPTAQARPPSAAAVDDNQPRSKQKHEALLSGNWWLWLLGLMAALLVVGVIRIQRGRPTPDVSATTGESTGDDKEDVLDGRLVWQQFDQACLEGDATEMRDSILLVGKILWNDNPPVSLDDIVRRVGPELGQALTDLNRQLYSPDKTDWDKTRIQRGFHRLKKQITKAQRDQSHPDLKPLHP